MQLLAVYLLYDVIFTSFVEEVEIVTHICYRLDIQVVTIDGSTSKSDRERNALHFNSIEEFRVIVVNTKVGGAGLNLQGGNFVYTLTIDTSPFVVFQSIGRVHRTGQKRTVTWYQVCGVSSIEKNNILSQQSKLDKQTMETKITDDQLQISNVINNYLDIAYINKSMSPTKRAKLSS